MFDDVVTLLEPKTVTDRYTEEERIDWTQPPTEYASDGVVQVVSSTEAVLTAGTVIQKARCWLPAAVPVGYGAGVYGASVYGGTVVLVTPRWRIRWEASTYEVDGAIEYKKVGTEIDHLHMWLRRVAD